MRRIHIREECMSMARCVECGGEVSSQAAVCPHCGIREPAGVIAGDGAPRHDGVGGVRGGEPVRRRGGGGWKLAIFLLLVLLALFGLWYGDIVNFT